MNITSTTLSELPSGNPDDVGYPGVDFKVICEPGQHRFKNHECIVCGIDMIEYAKGNYHGE